jgi:hypothetical protein
MPSSNIRFSTDIQLPCTQLPTTQLPTAHLPTTQLPTTQLPTTQLPTTQLPTTQSTQLPDPFTQSTQFPTAQSTQFSIVQSNQLPNQLPTANAFYEAIPASLPTSLPTGLPTSLPTMPLPPQAQYDSFDALYKSAQAFAKVNGYAFTINRSKATSSGRAKVMLDCDRHETHVDHHRRRERHTNTRSNGCQFSIMAYESLDKKSWELRYRPNSIHTVHNHPPSTHPSAHYAHRKLDQEQQKIVEGLVQAGSKPLIFIYILY